jgi:hypothetical protein
VKEVEEQGMAFNSSCGVTNFWFKTDKMLSIFGIFLKFSKGMSNLVKCCQNSALKLFKKSKVPFYIA